MKSRLASIFRSRLNPGSFQIAACTCVDRTAKAEMASPIILDGKKLSEFRVVDLRQELEKRGCEKSGVKAILIERLQKVKIYFSLR